MCRRLTAVGERVDARTAIYPVIFFLETLNYYFLEKEKTSPIPKTIISHLKSILFTLVYRNKEILLETFLLLLCKIQR